MAITLLIQLVLWEIAQLVWFLVGFNNWLPMILFAVWTIIYIITGIGLKLFFKNE